MVHSFDIFDTCLYRSCGNPKNVFDILAIRILNKQYIDEDVAYFSLIRSEGELKARINNPNREITIKDIYLHCNFSNLTSISNDTIMELEMKIESEVLYPNHSIKKMIDKLHKKGKSVCFISDMYLPSNFLKEILIREGLLRKGDSIFVSSEIGVTKSSGKLSDYVINKLQIKPFQLKHKGDNSKSDYLIPLKRGIFASLYKRKLTYYEKVLSATNTSPKFDYNHISANISNGIIKEKNNSNEVFAADFIAPILVTFVYHVLLDAKRRGIKSLYFLSRDGYLPYTIAKEFSDQFPDINIKYLYVSRRSLYFPISQPFDLANKNRFISQFSQQNVSQIIDYLQLDSMLEDNIKFFNSKELMSYIYATGKYKDIDKRRIEQKQYVINYFKQEGLTTNSQNIAIVDVRGTLRTQYSINEVLCSEGFNSVFGYYFEVQEDRLLDFKSSRYDSILNRERYTQIKPFKNFNKATDILEQYFCITDQERTKSYNKTKEGKIEPIFEHNTFEDYNKKRDLMNININVCKQYIKHFKISGLLYDDPKKLLYSMIYVFANFMTNPQKPYINALYNIIASQNRIDYKYIVSNLSLGNIVNKRIQWYDGSIKRNFGKIGLNIYQICYKILKTLK